MHKILPDAQTPSVLMRFPKSTPLPSKNPRSANWASRFL